MTLVAVPLVAVWWAPDPPRIALARPGSGLIGWACLPGMTRDGYVSQGQWRTDARTALAALRMEITYTRMSLGDPVAGVNPATCRRSGSVQKGAAISRGRL